MVKKGAHLNGLVIEEIAFGGEGIARLKTDLGDYVLFVANSFPGQTVTAKVIKKKKRYAKCKLLKVEQASKDELELPFQSIPGAPFARLPIELQENYKMQSTLEMFKRISSINNLDQLFDGFISSPHHWHYRNKMEYSFSTLISELNTGMEHEGFALGFKRRGQWWAVENLEMDSGLFDAQLENALSGIRAFCEQSGLPAWNPAQSNGFFRFLVVRKSFSEDKLLLNLVTTSSRLDEFDLDTFTKLLKNILGDRLAGLIHTINDDIGDAAKQESSKIETLYGNDTLTENINGIDFKISMQSFFQTNPHCAEKLYKKVIDYVRLGMQFSKKQAQIAMDLFCGTGTIAQLLAQTQSFEKVIGVDIIEQAINDARQNAERNQVKNIDFYAADVKRFLYEHPQYAGKIGTIVLDPPRGGIVPKALKRVLEIDAPAIVYVSCNPSTQARDCLEICAAGYKMIKFCLVDQFPHTAHIESIALFVKA